MTPDTKLKIFHFSKNNKSYVFQSSLAASKNYILRFILFLQQSFLTVYSNCLLIKLELLINSTLVYMHDV